MPCTFSKLTYVSQNRFHVMYAFFMLPSINNVGPEGVGVTTTFRLVCSRSPSQEYVCTCSLVIYILYASKVIFCWVLWMCLSRTSGTSGGPKPRGLWQKSKVYLLFTSCFCTNHHSVRTYSNMKFQASFGRLLSSSLQAWYCTYLAGYTQRYKILSHKRACV